MPNTILPNLELVFVPLGAFQLGGNDTVANDNEKPQHSVDIPDFRISKYPITNAQYAQFIQGTQQPYPTHWNNTEPPQALLDHPVVNITLQDTELFCEWLSGQHGRQYALPTEEQWEKAARGTNGAHRYVWGDVWQTNYCNTVETGIGETTAVSRFQHTNSSPYGVVDMLGNVWEWTKSHYLPYPGTPHEALHFGTSHYVVRGGSWHNDQKLARISCRGRYKPDVKRPYLGFRVVQIIPPVNLINLKKKLTSSFSKKELRDLCFRLMIDHEEFSHQGKDDFVQELILFCNRHGRMHELLTKLRELRSHIEW